MTTPLIRLVAFSVPKLEGLERLVRLPRFVGQLPGLGEQEADAFRHEVEAYPDNEVARYFFRFRSYVIVVGIAEIDGRAEPVSVEIRARMQGIQPRFRPFKAESLRPPWARIISEALRWHVYALEALATADPGAPDDIVVAAVRKSAHRRSVAARASSASRPSSDEVAQVYREADARREPPRKAVALHFGVTPSQAGHLVEKARDEDSLPAAPGPGKAGLEPRPKRKRKEH